MKTLYCPECKEDTEHKFRNITTKGDKFYKRFITLGFFTASFEKYYCTVCGNHNYTIDNSPCVIKKLYWSRCGTMCDCHEK